MKQKTKPGNTLLIIDDNLVDIEYLSILLKNKGYQVKKALTGKEGIRTASAGSPDLILLDMILPDRPGYEVCIELKNNPATASIPVIFISAIHESDGKRKAYEAGGLDYIIKPFNKEELLLKIGVHISLKQNQEILSEQNRQLSGEIQKRLAIEKQLEQIYNLLKKTARIARVGGWVIDTESMDQLWTEELYSIFEVDRDFKLTFENALSFFESNARDIFKNEVENTINHGSHFNLELPIKTAGGSKRWIHIVGEPEKDGNNGKVKKISGIIQEITRLKETQEALLHGKEREAEYLQIAGVMITALDTNYTISLVNHKTCSILGISFTDIIGLNLIDSFIPRDKQELFKDVLKQVKENSYDMDNHFECPLLQTSGNRRLISFTFTPIKDHEGVVREILLAGEDITEKNLLQEQLIQSERLGAVGQLAAGVAHEFNNILAIIKSIVQLIMMQQSMGLMDIPAEVQSELKKIDNQTKRGAEIVSNLMTLSKPISLGKDLYYIHDIIGDVLKLQKKQCELENIEIHTDYKDTKKVLIDRGQFQQVFLNLTLNARHALKAKGGGSIRINVKDRKNHIEVIFKDNGIGMNKLTKSKIFLPFFTTKRAELDSSNDAVKGTGLGLAVSLSILKNHNCTIGVESEEGEGTVFTLQVPCSVSGRAEQLKKTSKLNHILSHYDESLSKLKILIIDDEKEIASLFAKIIRSLGCSHTDRAHSLSEVKEKLEKKQYDLVFLDFLLPDSDGLEVYDFIRSVNSESTIVFMTGQFDTTFENSIKDLDIAGYIKKPFEIDEIIDFLKKVN